MIYTAPFAFGGEIYTIGVGNYTKKERLEVIDTINELRPNGICLEESSHKIKPDPNSYVSFLGYANVMGKKLREFKELFKIQDCKDLTAILKSEYFINNGELQGMTVALPLAKCLSIDLWTVEPYWPVSGGDDPYSVEWYKTVREPLVALNVIRVVNYYLKNKIEEPIVLNLTGDFHAKRINNLLDSYPSWATENFFVELIERIKRYTKEGIADGQPANELKLDWNVFLSELGKNPDF